MGAAAEIITKAAHGEVMIPQDLGSGLSEARFPQSGSHGSSRETVVLQSILSPLYTILNN
jgi:hypothetical protein